LSFLGALLLCVLLLTTSFTLIMFNINRDQEKAAARDRAVILADFLNLGIAGAVSDNIVLGNYARHDANSARITIIDFDGKVLLDSKGDAALMDNHSDREEFIAAIQSGSGDAIRHSETLALYTYYCAILLDDGRVLRVAMDMSNIDGVIYAIIPAIIGVTLLILVVGIASAHRLTVNIIRPIEHIDLSSEAIVPYDELVPYQRKIDRQKQEISEKIFALQERADTIEIITGAMREGLVLIDKDGIVLMANESAKNIFMSDTFGRDLMAQRNITHICRDIEFRRAVKQCLSGENTEIELMLGGRIYSVFFNPAMTSGFLRGENHIDGGIILIFDMTERYVSEKHRREFTANVSHELKTPLTAIIALGEMIENDIAKREDVKEFASKISEHANRLMSIINDIIKLSEFDEKKADTITEDFDLFALAENVADTLSENSKGVGIKITGERFNITANRRMIDELLYNLIDNGIKYNNDGGSVNLSLSGDGKSAKITVSDTGIGIPKEHLHRVFERFYRVDNSRSKKTGGTGLGLSIVKHIAEHHGGGVSVQSGDGEGTTVEVTIKGA